jgi:hypothetical protein
MGLFISCNGSNSSKQVNLNESPNNTGFTSESEIPISIQTVEDMNKSAEAVLQFRYKEQGKESYAAIEMDRWFYEFIADGAEIQPVEDGKWIDFYPDLTYTYGDESGQKGAGRFHYSLNTGLILLVDNDKNIKPQEFDVKVSGPVLVLVGKSTYKDNHLQMKLKMDNVPQ